MLFSLFRIISIVLSLFSALCFFRIILTWVRELSYSKAAQVLASICDPYLNLFRKIRWLKMGSFDFSPALALCLLGAASSVFNMLSNGGTVSIAMLIAMAVEVVFSILSSLITFVIILFAIRLVLLFIHRDRYNSSSFMMNQIDSSISPLVYRIARTFAMGRTLTYQSALIIAIISLIASQFILRILLNLLIRMLMMLPI